MQSLEKLLSQGNINEIQNYISRVIDALKSQDFQDFIKRKAKDVLNEITNESVNADYDMMFSHIYRYNHNVEIKDDNLIISNESEIPVDYINPDIAYNYPNGFDLAKAVEYGTGIVGLNDIAAELASENGWEYDINNHGQKGWFYKDDNGKLHWTQGMRGKLIFYRAKLKIQEQMSDWIDEYIDKL